MQTTFQVKLSRIIDWTCEYGGCSLVAYVKNIIVIDISIYKASLNELNPIQFEDRNLFDHIIICLLKLLK